MEGVGERWWPVFGAVYFLVAVKRVRGMRLVGLARQRGAQGAHARPAVVANRQRQPARGAVRVKRSGDLHRRCLQGQPGPRRLGRVAAQSATHEKELFGGERLTTNNRMELTAVIEALASLKQPCDVTIYTDSQYVRNGITELDPRLEGARLEDGRPQAGEERRPVAAARRAGAASTRCEWRWVKGHAGDPGNERADALANRGVPRAA